MRGSGLITPEMHVPGTGHLRLSILALWADILGGYLAVRSVGPRVPVTLDLDLHLPRPAPAAGAITGTARAEKIGRSVFVARVDFTADDGSAVGFAGLSFMAAPDKRLTIALPTDGGQPLADAPTLSAPFAERVGCERIGPGITRLFRSDEVLNASNTINGGLLALMAEEAALSLSPGATLSSLGLRYLQPARVGPAVAEASVSDGLGRVEVRDAGNENRLCVVATSRTFEP
jgi:acyl-coenzyme A thioesterase PaaI-like protein